MMDSRTTTIASISQLHPRATTPLDCTTAYSGDYYGFGVRMGIYFAWFGSYLANIALPSEISSALDTNSFFLFALLISLFRGTVKNDLFEIDGLISMHLSSGFIFTSLSIWGYRTLHYAREGPGAIHYFGGFGTHSRLVLKTAISVYGTWFWWRGVDGGLAKADDASCREVFTWFFHLWKVAGGVRILYIIMTVGTSLFHSIMCVSAAASLLYRLMSIKHRHRIRLETGFSTKELTFLFKFFRVFSLLYIIFCIIMIELTLRENHMINSLPSTTSVASPAQLIPLSIGILSFVRIVFLLYVDATGRFGKIWRFDANDYGQHQQAAQSPNPQAKFLGINIRGFLGPVGIYSRANTNESEMLAARHSPNRPWWKRHSVGILPWLSVFGFWRHVSPQDVEQAAIREKMEQDEKPTDRQVPHMSMSPGTCIS